MFMTACGHCYNIFSRNITQFSSSIRFFVCRFFDGTEDYLPHNLNFHSPTVANGHFMKHMHTLQAFLFAFDNFPTGTLKVPSLAEFYVATPDSGISYLLSLLCLPFP